MESNNENNNNDVEIKIEKKDEDETIINNNEETTSANIDIDMVKKEEVEQDNIANSNIEQKSNSPLNITGNSPTSTATVAVQPTAIPQPKKTIQIEILENRIKNDVYDTEAWTLLLGEIQSQPIDNCRAIYERFLSSFPTAGKYWKVYAEQEMLAKNYESVEKLFLRSLKNVRNVELWKTYITYIKLTKTNKEEITKAFEYALEFIGMDISSTPIWQEYLTFLKDEKTASPFDEGQKMTSIRKLYQRAIENPMHDLEQIYKDYEQFENSINKVLAKSLLGEHYSKYQQAKNVYKERKSLLEGILRNMLAKPPGSSDKEEHQVKLWRKLLNYEKSNPQKFEQQVLRNRVAATYSQCLLCLYHYPDMWYEAALYQLETGNIEGGNLFFEKALSAIPKSLFLHFAYADSLESQKKIPQAKEVYEKLITSTTISSPSIATPILTTPSGTTTAPSSTTGPLAPTINVGGVDPLVWIQYMRFSRRTERIEGPRKIFKRAKAQPDCTYHVYIALGLIEYYVNQDPKMARDIFELGLKKFPLEAPFIDFYIDFLSNLNEENNTRVLFEKLLVLPSHNKSTIDSFWRKYLDFEYRQNQDIHSIIKLEKRYQQLYQANHPHTLDKLNVIQALNRYKFLNLSPCHPTEMEVISRNLLLQTDNDDRDRENGLASSFPFSKEDQPSTSKVKKHKKDKHEKSSGLSSASSLEAGSFTENAEKPTSSTTIPVSTWKVKRPDITVMQPYRGEVNKFSTGTGGTSGSVGLNSPISRSQLEIPEFFYPILQLLPSTSSFNGPYIDVDLLIMTIKDSPLPITNSQSISPTQTALLNTQPATPVNISLPIQAQVPGGIPPNISSPTNTNTVNVISSTSPLASSPNTNSPTNTNNPLKRKLDEEEQPTQPAQSYSFSNTKPPSNDIYRKRQASKLSKKG